MIRSALLLALALSLPALAQDDEARYDAIFPVVEKMRGLKFEQRVPYTPQTPDQIRERFEKAAAQEAPQVKNSDDGFTFVLEKLGMLPAGFDLRSNVTSLYGQQVSGLYEPSTKRFVVTRDPKKPKPSADQYTQEELTAVHELTHALQDQHFDLKGLLGSQGDSDQTLAARSLPEGDAQLMATAYELKSTNLGLDQIRDRHKLSRFKLDPKTPMVLQRFLTFPYGPGQELVLTVYRAGGWPLVNQMYEDPPQSTEQVLHPEKYLDDRDAPQQVKLTLPASWQGWDQLEDDTGGEFLVRTFLEQRLGAAQAVPASAGWGGDRYRIYRKGDQRFAFWIINWDNPSKASSFARLVKPLIAKAGRVEMLDPKTLVMLLAVPPELEKPLLAELGQFTLHALSVTPKVRRPAAGTFKPTDLETTAKLNYKLANGEFQSLTYGFTLKVPDGWGADPNTKSPTVPLRLVRAGKTTAAVIQVVRLPGESSLDAKQIAAQLEAELNPVLRGFKIGETHNVTVGGNPFYEFVGAGGGRSYAVYRGQGMGGWTYTVLLTASPGEFVVARGELMRSLAGMKFAPPTP